MPVTVLRTRNGVLDNEDRHALNELSARLAGGSTKVLLYLHGGLVDQAHGEATAARLSGAGPHGFNASADWEQIYVVWRTGALETIRTNWTDLATNDRLYRALLKRLFGFLLSKLQLSDGTGRSAFAAVGLSPTEITARLSGTSAQPIDQPFADVDATLAGNRPDGRGAAIENVPDAYIAAEFSTMLQLDPEFTAAVEDIDAALNPSRPGARGVSGHGDAIEGAQSLGRLDRKVQTELQAAVPTADGRVVLTSLAVLRELVKHGAAVALRVISRYRRGREHGIQATIVEELARELYGDLVGATIWEMMKRDAREHFAPNGFLGFRAFDRTDGGHASEAGGNRS